MRRVAGNDGKLAGLFYFVKGYELVFFDDRPEHIGNRNAPQYNDYKLEGAPFAENFMDC